MERLEASDLGFLYGLARLRRPWLTEIALAVTTLGNFLTLFSVVLLAALAFALARRWRFAGLVLAVGLVSWGLESGVKVLVKRPRPMVVEHLSPLPGGPSFPSGHALCSMAIYGTIGLLASRLVRRRGLANFLAGAGIALGVLVGMTRPYLGVHFPSDVLAGWCAGLACALLASALAGTDPVRPTVQAGTAGRNP